MSEKFKTALENFEEVMGSYIENDVVTLPPMSEVPEEHIMVALEFFRACAQEKINGGDDMGLSDHFCAQLLRGPFIYG